MDSPNPSSLSTTETEIIIHLVAGRNAAEIATILQLTEDQVQDHLLALFEKTGCDTRTQLAASWALYGDAFEHRRSNPDPLRQRIDLLTLERNALRQRVNELLNIVDYLLGRPPRHDPAQPSADLLRIERDALRQRLRRLESPPPATPHLAPSA